MARQMDLIPQARIDLEGFCVPIQMQLCVAKRYQPRMTAMAGQSLA
jgi:hypothetical protein